APPAPPRRPGGRSSGLAFYSSQTEPGAANGCRRPSARPTRPHALCLGAVEVMELPHRGLDREHLELKAPTEAVQTRLALETLQERARPAPLDLPGVGPELP